MQMFRGFSARLMEATRRLGIEGLVLPSAPEDDGAILHFFGQLSDMLAEAATKVTKLIDANCRELLGLAETRIFSNIQRLCPNLDLEEVLQRRAATPPGTPNREALSRAAALTLLFVACRPSIPAREHPWPQDWRAPPAEKQRAPRKMTMKKSQSPATAEQWSPAARERRPQRQA
jgi:hypothetical protein